MAYELWRVEHVFVRCLHRLRRKVSASFKEYPPSQKPGSFSLDNVMESLQRGVGD